MDAEMASWKSTGTYVDEVPPPGANIVSGMWIFRVKRLPGYPPVFKARYVTRGFSQRQGVDFFQTFSPTPKMTTLWAPREWHNTLRASIAALGFAPSTADPSLFLRTHTTLPPFYVLMYVDDLVFATADAEPLANVLQRFGFTYSSPQSTPLSTGHSLSAPPLVESVEPSGPYPELVGCLMYLMTCTRPDLAYPLSLLARYVAPGRHRKVHWDAAKRVLRYLCSTSGMGLVHGGRAQVVLTGHAVASWVEDLATQRSSQGYTFSLGSGSVSWRSTCSSSVLSSSCEAEIYAGAMAAQELRWLTYVLTDLGEVPRSPPVLYVDNKAMLALCQEHRLEHRTKNIALCYFLARELQQCGQLRLAYSTLRGDFVIHPELALPFLTGLVTSCLLLVPTCFLVHSFVPDSNSEFSSDLLRAFCRAEGIHQTFTLPASPQQNGIAERRIGMVMDLARTSMIHAAGPHFLWPFVVQYAAHQINLQPRVSLPKSTPTLRWTGKVGDASVFRVWGSRAFVRDTSVDKLSSCAVPCVFLGFPHDAPGWQLYHPTSRRVLSSQDVTFDESVSYYRLFPYSTSSLPPPSSIPSTRFSSVVLSLRVRGLGVLCLGLLSLRVRSPGGAEPERMEPGGVEPEGAESRGAELGGAEPERAESGGPRGVPSRAAAGGASGAGAAGGTAGVGAAGGTRAAGRGGARAGGTGAARAGGAAGVGAVGAWAVAIGGTAGAAGGTGAGGAAGVVAGHPGGEGTGAVSAESGGATRPRPYYVLLLQQ
ncbi:unnamed protein product, partial [Closterium sp. NIES-54]